MAIKLLALDLDGTLLDEEFRIRPRTRRALVAAAARGITLCLVTGRMFCSAARYAQELGLHGQPLIAYNGALVQEFPSGRRIDHTPLPLAAARRILAHCAERGYYVQAYVEDQVYVNEINAKTREYCRIAGVEAVAVGCLLDFLQAPPTKLLIYEPEAMIPGIQRELHSLLAGAVNLAQSYPYFLEVVSPHAAKGRALRQLAASLGLQREEVMAAGDGMNDLSMLQWAGLSVAMAHAPAALKAVVNYVAAAPPGEGVAEAVEALLLR